MAWSLPGRGGTATVLHPTIRRGDRGIQVWAVQRALNDIGRSRTLTLDGDYGPSTEGAVKEFQDNTTGLTVDGVAGPLTQRKICGILIDSRERVEVLPPTLLRGFAQGEGGWLVAPLNWSSPGGVDCGLLQRRVYEAQYGDNLAIERAFNTAYQARLLADRLQELQAIFRPRAGTNDGYGGMSALEKSWRLAALNHNYPSAADRLSRTPIRELSSYWTTEQSWVTRYGFRFPNGVAVRTPLEWCHLYAGVLAGAHGHRGNVTRDVKDWSP